MMIFVHPSPQPIFRQYPLWGVFFRKKTLRLPPIIDKHRLPKRIKASLSAARFFFHITMKKPYLGGNTWPFKCSNFAVYFKHTYY